MEKLTAGFTTVIQSMAEDVRLVAGDVITHPTPLILFAVPTVWKIRHIFSK